MSETLLNAIGIIYENLWKIGKFSGDLKKGQKVLVYKQDAGESMN